LGVPGNAAFENIHEHLAAHANVQRKRVLDEIEEAGVVPLVGLRKISFEG